MSWMLVAWLVWWLGGTVLLLWMLHLHEDVMADTAIAVLVFCAIAGPMPFILTYVLEHWGRHIPPWPFVVWRARKRGGENR
jgi:hypothetical protein